ncbi:hypothetical protein ZWY2020_058082 [Hordeum vulgare]|nr:hypothetical protein ZWY2020_058082 [Hordeum vulgare]
MDSGANSVGSVGESPPPVSPPGRPVAKGRGLRRWRRIPREHHDDEGGSPAGPVAAAAPPTLALRWTWRSSISAVSPSAPTRQGEAGGLDPYTDSMSLLQSAQEALENELQMFVEIGKESSDNSTDIYDENEWISSPNCEYFSEEISEKLKLLESKLEEASLLIDEKDSRILELDTLNQTQPREAALYNSKLLSLQSEVDQLLMEKMGEIQCFILKRASEAWQPQTEGQGTLHEAQKSLSEDHKQLEVKLRHTENRARTLEEMVEKLESQCKELSNASEVLKLQAGASRASLFCSVQLVLLCVAVWTFVARFLPTPPEFVPT